MSARHIKRDLITGLAIGVYSCGVFAVSAHINRHEATPIQAEKSDVQLIRPAAPANNSRVHAI